MTRSLLEASGLCRAFGAKRVLDGVDLELLAGELLLVLGPNGAGKTTLVRLLSGVLPPDGGSVRLAGRALETLERREIARQLAVVPQELAVPFPYGVREMVAMGRAPHLSGFGREGPADRRAIEVALERLGLRELATRSFSTLSGGEKQRVSLARALAQEADAMLLDEPTAQMDLGHRIHAFEWLRDWVAERPGSRAALVVTHDLVLAARFADRLLLLDRGRVVAAGPPAGVLTPARIEAVYGVEAEVSLDASGRPIVFAGRSRIRYTAAPDAQDP